MSSFRSPQSDTQNVSDLSQLTWIAVDWGTTHLRAWAIGGTKTILASATSEKGMGALQPREFEAALLELVSEWLGDRRAVPVLACGMVGARQGWEEAEYLPVPTYPLVPDLFHAVKPADPRLEVFIVPGLKQLVPPDVIRGEETQIAGFLADTSQFEGLICMPGTHTKWAHVAAGKVTRFQSFMTGEVFSLLERQSVLRHSVDRDAFDLPTFESTLAQVLGDPTLAISGLFAIRADDLLNHADPAVLRTKLSAYLIGSEVHAAIGNMKPTTTVLIGAADLTMLYSKALVMKGFTAAQRDAGELTLRGLFAAWALLNDKGK